MTSPTGPDEGVLQELKRRRVVRVVMAYLVVGLGVLTSADLLLDLFGGPEWAFRAVLGAMAMGFPVTAVLAWIYDVTPEGIVRTPEDPPAIPPGEATPPWAWHATVALGVLLTLASWFARRALL